MLLNVNGPKCFIPTTYAPITVNKHVKWIRAREYNCKCIECEPISSSKMHYCTIDVVCVLTIKENQCSR